MKTVQYTFMVLLSLFSGTAVSSFTMPSSVSTRPFLSTPMTTSLSMSSSSSTHKSPPFPTILTTTTTTVASLLHHPTVTNAIETATTTSDLDVEFAELPPVWVPILFAIFILGGVGLLTSSLGNVMDEEASLGLMSGAKAKKERERSRSSYFKNRN